MLPNSKSLLPVAQSFGTAVRVLHAPRWIAHQCLVTLFFFSRVFFNSPFLPQPVIAHLPLFIHLCSVVCITLCIHLQIMACMNLLLALPSCVCPATALPELYRPPVHACTLQSTSHPASDSFLLHAGARMCLRTGHARFLRPARARLYFVIRMLHLFFRPSENAGPVAPL